MMFLVKFAGLILCLGILAFGGYKTVEGIRIEEMIGEIASVMEDGPIFPSAGLPDGDDPDSPDTDDPVIPPSKDETVGGESGGDSVQNPDSVPDDIPDSKPNPEPNPEPSPEPEPEPSPSGSLSTDEAIDAFGGLYDNHDPDFNEINKEFFVGMVEGVLSGSSNGSEPPVENDPDFDNSFDSDFDDSFDSDVPFIPEEDPDDDEHKVENIIIDVAGNYYENLQQGIQNNIASNSGASAEEQQAARDEFIRQEAEAFAGLLNIATKPEETTEEQIVQSVDAVLKSDVCLDTVTQTVTGNDAITDTVRDATEGMAESYKADIEDRLNAALAENPEKAQQYNDLANLFGITLGGH